MCQQVAIAKKPHWKTETSREGVQKILDHWQSTNLTAVKVFLFKNLRCRLSGYILCVYFETQWKQVFCFDWRFEIPAGSDCAGSFVGEWEFVCRTCMHVVELDYSILKRRVRTRTISFSQGAHPKSTDQHNCFWELSLCFRKTNLEKSAPKKKVGNNFVNWIFMFQCRVKQEYTCCGWTILVEHRLWWLRYIRSYTQKSFLQIPFIASPFIEFVSLSTK